MGRDHSDDDENEDETDAEGDDDSDDGDEDDERSEGENGDGSSVEDEIQDAQRAVFIEDRQATAERRAGVDRSGDRSGDRSTGANPQQQRKHGFMRAHPLFPQEDDAPEYKRNFVWLHISRQNPETGVVENHPERFPAGRLKSWQDIHTMCGGGNYRIWATNEGSRFTAFFPPTPGDYYTIPGDPRPFSKESATNVVRARIAAPVNVPANVPAPPAAPAAVASAPSPAIPTMKDFKEMIDAAVAARMPAPVAVAPPSGLSTAELMAAGSTAVASIITAIMSRPPPPPPPDTMTPMLKMMEIQSAERNAQLQAAAASGSKSDSNAELLKIMLASRDKPMGPQEMVALISAMKGNDKPMSPIELVSLIKAMKDDKGGGPQGIDGVLDLMKKVKDIQGPAAATPASDLAELTSLIGTVGPMVLKASDQSTANAAPAQKPKREVLVPGVGVMTEPSPQLMEKLNAMGASMLGGQAPPLGLPPAPPAVTTVVAPAAVPASVPAQVAPAQTAPVQATPAQTAPVQATPAQTAPVRAVAPVVEAAPAPVAVVAAAPLSAPLSDDEAADAFVARLRNDVTFHARVSQRLAAIQTPTPPVEPEPEPEPEPEAKPVLVAELEAELEAVAARTAPPTGSTVVAVPKLPDGMDLHNLPPQLLEFAQQNPEMAAALMRGEPIDLTETMAGLPEDVRNMIQGMITTMSAPQ